MGGIGQIYNVCNQGRRENNSANPLEGNSPYTIFVDNSS
jgi:hypothetical protein